jgi:hypothetical protein
LGYWHYSNERQRWSTLSSVEALIEVYMSANESQMLRDEYSHATKVLDAEYKFNMRFLPLSWKHLLYVERTIAIYDLF